MKRKFIFATALAVIVLGISIIPQVPKNNGFAEERYHEPVRMQGTTTPRSGGPEVINKGKVHNASSGQGHVSHVLKFPENARQSDDALSSKPAQQFVR